jgi:hypothetical protein
MSDAYIRGLRRTMTAKSPVMRLAIALAAVVVAATAVLPQKAKRPSDPPEILRIRR